MKALLSQGKTVTLDDLPVPEIGSGDLLIKVNACGVCVSDLHKLHFRSLPEPTVLGHEIAGLVAKAGSKVKRFHEGDRVVLAHHVPCGSCHFCLRGSYSMCEQFRQTGLDPGGFSEFVRVPALHVENVTFPIPDGLCDSEACFMEPLGCCLRAIKRVKLQAGDTAVIVGLGSIGLLLGQLVRAFGGQCYGVDLDPARGKFAESLGFLGSAQGLTEAMKAKVLSATSNRGADVLIVTAGGPAMVPEAISGRAGGTLNIFASFHPESRVTLDWNDLYYREVNVVSSYSPSPLDLKEALALLAEGKVDVSRLATNVFRSTASMKRWNPWKRKSS